MKARYQYRFYPTDQQRVRLAQLFGCVRVVWNDALAVCKQSEKYPRYNKLSAMLTQSKKTDDRKWLADVSSVPLQQSLKQLDQAYKNYFDSLAGKRKGRKVGLPKFKKKSSQQSATFTSAAFKVSDGIVYLAKIGDLKPIWSRELPSKPSSVTVIKDAANRYFLSFVVDVQPVKTDAKNSCIGIDLGIKTFAVMSDGSKAESPDYSRLDRKLRRLQKKLARQPKESNRREVTRLRIAKIHKKIIDKRNDFLHKLSTKIVSENQVTILEDLNVSGMVKNRKLARAISLQGWRQFRDRCESKAKKFLDREFRTISRWEPTSQYCSVCGSKWGKLDLSIRSIKCLNCGAEHDRDENAARNIAQVGIGHCHDSKWARIDCKTTSGAS
jgi:putative transposase